MAKPSKTAIVLNQNNWAIRLAERRAKESDARAPTEESNHKGFIVNVPNASDILAWCLDEIGRQEGELSAEAQCWQDHSTKRKMLDWNNNCKAITENIGDLLQVTNQLTHAGVKLPETLPWNENGPAAINMDVIMAEAVEEILEAEVLEESSDAPTEV